MSFVLLGILNSQAAGGGAAPEPAFFHISTTTVSANTDDPVTITNIPQDYKHLQIRINHQANTTNTNNLKAGFRINNNSSNAIMSIDGDFNSIDPYDGSTGSIEYNSMGRSDSAATNIGIITIMDYTETTKRKGATIISGNCVDNFGAQRVGIVHGVTSTTSAVSSITFTGNGTAAGSRISIYGVMG